VYLLEALIGSLGCLCPLAGHRGRGRYSEPIKAQSGSTQPTQSAGICVRTSHD